MNKKAFTVLFVVLSTLANIVLTLGLIFLFAVGGVLILKYFVKVDSGDYYTITAMVAIILGLLLSFFIYSKVSMKLIQKFGNEHKFEDSWFRRRGGRYTKPASSSDEAETQEDNTEHKTKMPSSVLPTEEEKAEQEKWGK